jgi:phosphate transport system substrate-binding protein
MNKLVSITALAVILFCAGCKEEGFNLDNLGGSLIIEGLTVDNYPKMDGSTSTEPLNAIIACRLLDVRYKWAPDYWNLQRVEPALNNMNKDDADKFLKLIKSSQTHQSFINLINKDADLLLTARKMSPDEKTYADAAGVGLIETPIALDALVFIVNPNNSIESLTNKQIQDIYTGKIIRWNEAGGKDNEIMPYMRNPNSGSQELMETLAMKGLDITALPVNNDELIIFNMTGAFDAVIYEDNAICYTVYYFKEYMVTGVDVKSVAIDGIYPDKATIGNRTYPYVAEVYAVIRADPNKSSMAYKLYEWLQTEAGKQIISESGYIPYY